MTPLAYDSCQSINGKPSLMLIFEYMSPYLGFVDVKCTITFNESTRAKKGYRKICPGALCFRNQRSSDFTRKHNTIQLMFGFVKHDIGTVYNSALIFCTIKDLFQRFCVCSCLMCYNI